MIRFFNQAVERAMELGASDIHLEPFEKTFKVRQRIDGVLYDTEAIPKKAQEAITSRVKVMGKMANFGARMINGVADQLIEQFLTNFSNRVLAAGEGAAAEAAATRASTATRSLPSRCARRARNKCAGA